MLYKGQYDQRCEFLQKNFVENEMNIIMKNHTF